MLKIYREEEERFLTFIDVESSFFGCWLWTGFIDLQGYAKFCRWYGVDYAHIFSYESYIGEIPKGKQIDHICQVKHCVFYEHLRAVYPSENAMNRIIQRPSLLIAK